MAEAPAGFMAVWNIYLPILLVVITLGNCLALLILLRKKLRRRRGTIYLITLSIADLLAVYTGLFAASWDEFALNHMTPLCSKLQAYINCVSRTIGAYVIVALALERVVTVCWPLTSARRCKNKVAYVILSAILIVVSAFYSHQMMGVQVFCRGLVDPLCPVEWHSHLRKWIFSGNISSSWRTRTAKQTRNLRASRGVRDASREGAVFSYGFPNATMRPCHVSDGGGCILDSGCSLEKHPADHAPCWDVRKENLKKGAEDGAKSRQEVSRSIEDAILSRPTPEASRQALAMQKELMASIKKILPGSRQEIRGSTRIPMGKRQKFKRRAQLQTGKRQELIASSGRKIIGNKSKFTGRKEEHTQIPEEELVSDGNANGTESMPDIPELLTNSERLTGSRELLINSGYIAERLSDNQEPLTDSGDTIENLTDSKEPNVKSGNTAEYIIHSKRRVRAAEEGVGGGREGGKIEDAVDVYRNAVNKLKVQGYNRGMCAYMDFLLDVWPKVDQVAYFILPQLVVLAANAALVYKVCCKTRWTFQMPTEDGNTKRLTGVGHRKASNMTKLTWVLSLLLLLSTLPITLDLFVEGKEGFIAWRSEGSELTWAVTAIIIYTRGMFDFLLFYSLAPHFRQEFHDFLVGLRKLCTQCVRSCRDQGVSAGNVITSSLFSRWQQNRSTPIESLDQVRQARLALEQDDSPSVTVKYHEALAALKESVVLARPARNKSGTDVHRTSFKGGILHSRSDINPRHVFNQYLLFQPGVLSPVTESSSEPSQSPPHSTTLGQHSSSPTLLSATYCLDSATTSQHSTTITF